MKSFNKNKIIIAIILDWTLGPWEKSQNRITTYTKIEPFSTDTFSPEDLISQKKKYAVYSSLSTQLSTEVAKLTRQRAFCLIFTPEIGPKNRLGRMQRAILDYPNATVHSMPVLRITSCQKIKSWSDCKMGLFSDHKFHLLYIFDISILDPAIPR